MKKILIIFLLLFSCSKENVELRKEEKIKNIEKKQEELRVIKKNFIKEFFIKNNLPEDNKINEKVINLPWADDFLNKIAEIDDKIIDLNIEIADLEWRVEYIKK